MSITPGLREVARRVRALQRRALHLLLERGLLDTAGQVQLEELGVAAPARNRYEPSGYTFLRRALRGAQIGPGAVFVDYGSGKGRVLLGAVRYPFDRVIGVEISEQLNDIARENVARARDRQRCRQVEIITADATAWPLPDDVTHLYVYNSVGEELFRKIVDRIVESLDRQPRRLTVMYANPVFADALSETGRFRLTRTSRGMRPDQRNQTIKVFQSDDRGTPNQ